MENIKKYKKTDRISDYRTAVARRDYMNTPVTPRPKPQAQLVVAASLEDAARSFGLKSSYSDLKLKLKSLNRRSTLTKNLTARVGTLVAISVLVIAQITGLLPVFFAHKSYALGPAESLLSPVNQLMAEMLKYDARQQAYSFNAGYHPPAAGIAQAAGPLASAVAYQDSGHGIVVTDSANKISFSLIPDYGLGNG